MQVSLLFINIDGRPLHDILPSDHSLSGLQIGLCILGLTESLLKLLILEYEEFHSSAHESKYYNFTKFHCGTHKVTIQKFLAEERKTRCGTLQPTKSEELTRLGIK